MSKGAPQGPFPYNIHGNDLIVTQIFNYTDDNTLMCHGKTVSEVKRKAETDINKMLDWFKVNQIKVNDEKFQSIAFGRNKTISDEYVLVGSNEIMSSFCVKLLGVYFDQNKFDYHIG